MDEYDAYNYQVSQSNARTTPEDEYAGSLREERVRSLLTEIDPANQVESIIMRIRGYRYDKTTEMWVKRKSAPNISENFIAKVEYILSEELSLNTTFSNLQPSDVNSIMALLIDILVSDVVVHGRNYTVELDGQRFNLADDHNLKEIVLYGVFSAVYKSLRRSINGTEAKRFFGSLRMNETINPPRQNKSGFMEAIKSLYN
jgi:hypothetical protein